MNFLKKLFGGGSKPPATSKSRESFPYEQVKTNSGVLRFHRGQFFGCLYDEANNVHSFWISEEWRQKSHKEIVLQLQMSCIHWEESGGPVLDLATSAAYEKAVELGIIEFIPQPKRIGGYVVTMDFKKFDEYLEQKKR